MQPGKSDSFNFQRSASSNSSTSSSRSAGMQNCRRKLQNTFEETDKEKESKSASSSVLSVLSFNDNTMRVLRNGAERITKTFNSVRTTFGTITQVSLLKFRVLLSLGSFPGSNINSISHFPIYCERY